MSEILKYVRDASREAADWLEAEIINQEEDAQDTLLAMEGAA